MEGHVDLAKKYLTSMGAGDHHSNGLLFGVHIHRCFDDYQFSIYVSRTIVYAIIDAHSDPQPDPQDGHRRKIYTFEKDIPPFLKDVKTELLPPLGEPEPTTRSKAKTGINVAKPEDNPYLDVFNWLLMEHFRTALLWHVAGLGQKAKGSRK